MGKVGISFAIGGSIAAVIMVIGMITLVAGTATPTASSFNIHAYYTVTVTDPDGNIKAISHGENAPTHLLKDCLFEGFFTGVFAKFQCVITTTEIAVGDGGENITGDLDARTDLFHRYSNSGNGTAVQSLPTSSADGETTITFSNVADPITLLESDLTVGTTGNSADNGVCTDLGGSVGVDCFMDEVALYATAGNMLSRADIDPSVEVSVGDQVDVTILITLT